MVKRDEFRLRHSKDKIRGTIKRIYPKDSEPKRWKIEGRIIGGNMGNNLFAIFWSVDEPGTSYGSIYMHRQKDLSFAGYYLKFDKDATSGVKPIKIELRRATKESVTVENEE